MSQKQIKQESPGMRAAKGGGVKKNDKNTNNKPDVDSKFKENVVRKLYDSFQDSFSLEQISAVAHTCQWDLCRATEALMILGDTPKTKKGKNAKGHHNNLTKNKTKSLPSTLKSHGHKSSESLYATPNGLRSNPAHVSTNSLSSGQVWQRHYKSKPQSPGLLTMIPPVRETVKLKKTGSARSLPSTSTIAKNKESPEVKKASAAVLRIQQLVQDGVKVMVLMRGVPGSGKTHLAQVVVGLVTSNELSQHIFSTDDYFILLGRGQYAYDSNQLPQAHNWNQKRCSEALRRATNPVVVDNTHTQAWEMQAYVAMAVQHGYLIEVLEPVTPWRKNEAELARRNIHSVPREKIRQMLDKYEPGWTGDKLLQLFGLKYMHCGAAHVPHELTSYSNSPLAQHRQHSVIETPEKPKRKKNNTKKKDRRTLPGIEITEDTEKQLNELNQLFAEYGKTLDPVSKKIVLESGVPISEVIARLRQKQGKDIPLPKTNVPPTIPETGRPMAFYDNHVIKPVPNYPRDSPSESVEPDTMSSSNASETSECETDTDAELQGLRNYIGYGCEGRFVDGEDAWEDYDDDEGRAKSAGAVGSSSGGKSSKIQSLVTSSQEELSLIDFEVSTNTTRSSQEELSIIDYDEDDSPNAKNRSRSSSSSEEQETQLLTLQESLREVLIDNLEKRRCLEDAQLAEQKKAQEDKNDNKTAEESAAHIVELTDSLLEVINRRFAIKEEPPTLDKENNVVESKRSPDLEEIPLPSIPPPGSKDSKDPKDDRKKRSDDQWKNLQSWANPNSQLPQLDKIDEIISSWEHPTEPEPKDYSSPKPARPKGNLLGAIKKTGIQRDKSPEELLRSIELQWSSIPFTSSWENLNKRPGDPASGIYPKPQRKLVEKSEASTNTDHNDFDLWKTEDESVVKLATQGRNINQNLTSQPIPQISQIPEVLMLDKGSMTVDVDDFDSVGIDSAMENLANMFPDIPRDHLSDILEKCKGNIHWAVELLLESASLGTASYFNKDKPSSSSTDAADPTSAIPSNLGNLISDGKKTIKRRKDKKNVPSELSLLLKKQIEESIHINEDLYQDKTLFLKKLRHGEIDLDAPVDPFLEPCLPPEPVLTDEGDGLPELADFAQEEEEEEEEEETMALNMDPEFFERLVKKFGSPDAPSTSQKASGFIPTINIPVSLAHQIYCCWLETINRQVEEMESIYEKMIKEDEMLAAALQEQEYDQRKPDLREVMDMELAMALYKQDQEKIQENAQETMASKLSKQLLFEEYPNVDKKVLLDLFRSQGNSFQKTVEILNSQVDELPKTVMSQEFLAAYEQELIDQAKRESLKKEVENVHKPIIIIREPLSKIKAKSNETKDTLVVNPAEFRQKISLLHQRRNDCCLHAQEAHRKKSYSVASYFSHLATLYKERIQEMESNAISMKLFEEKEDEVLTKIDLHYLFVNEALQVLDLFLDHHIKQLNKKTKNSSDLYLITGRGQRSIKGKSRIKPAVKKRLDDRKLNYVEDNPGMLKVVIRKGDKLSDQL